VSIKQELRRDYMKLAYAILADAAQVTPDGKFSILGGGIEILNSVALPAMVPSLALIIRLSLDPDSLSIQHILQVELVDPDGLQSLANIAESSFTPEQKISIKEGILPSTTFVFNFLGISFPKTGKYTFNIILDQEIIGSLFIHLVTSSNNEETKEKET
jgi:hypothetical protein